jgi:hypothetical protein
MRAGRLLWIGLRAARRAPMLMPESARLVAGQGVSGDRYGPAVTTPCAAMAASPQG